MGWLVLKYLDLVFVLRPPSVATFPGRNDSVHSFTHLVIVNLMGKADASHKVLWSCHRLPPVSSHTLAL